MLRPLGVLAGLLLLTGCSGGNPTAKPDQGESSSPSASASTTPSLTKADVNGAIRTFAKAGTGSYYVRGTLAAEAPAATHTGRYDLSAGYADELVSPSGTGAPPPKVRTIAIARESWIQIETDGERTCWMHFTPEDGEAFGVDLGAGSRGIPPIAYVVSTLEAEDDGTATSDLYSVLQLFSGKTPRALGIAPGSPYRVPVTLDLEDGVIDRISVSPEQLVGAIGDAGLDLGPLADLRDDLSVTVQLTEYGEKVDVVRPPREFTVEVADQEQFERDRLECDQRLADAS